MRQLRMRKSRKIILAFFFVLIPLSACTSSNMLQSQSRESNTGVSEPGLDSVPTPTDPFGNPTTLMQSKNQETDLPTSQPGRNDADLMTPSFENQGQRSINESISLKDLDDGVSKFILFYGPDCLSCEEMEPRIDELANSFTGEIAFYYLDSQDPENVPVIEALGFRYAPHYFLINGTGDIVVDWQGIVHEEQFWSAFADLLSEEAPEK